MSGFQDRERNEETRYVHDAELTFRATARRDRLIGQWIAAEFLGLSGDAAADFAAAVVASNFEKPGDDDVIAFVLGKVAAAGGELTEARLTHKMGELFTEAMAQIKSGG